MLLKLSDPVSECLRRAEECRRRAKIAMDAASIPYQRCSSSITSKSE